jgi:tetratricopeptide (TPR) repeat protein
VSPRARVYLNVAIATVAAVGIVVGLTLDTRTDPVQPKPFPGKPPVPTGLPGRSGLAIEQAFRDWPHGSIDAVQKLGLQYPENAVVQYYRGVALLWAGYPSDAESALQLAKKFGTDTIIQGRADDLLHPDYFEPTSGPPYPVFQPLAPNALLERGSTLQAEGHQESAVRLYARAARLDPGDAEAQVAAGVGLFDEDNLSPAFSKLDSVMKRFPRSQSVHYYLGYLFAWTRQGSAAVTQFEQAVKLGPTTELGKASTRLLDGIAQAGSSAAAG